MDEVQDFIVDIAQMSPVSLNFWMMKFVREFKNWKPFRWSVPSKNTVSNQLYVYGFCVPVLFKKRGFGVLYYQLQSKKPVSGLCEVAYIILLG